MRNPIEIPDKHKLESKGLTLESTFIESDPTKATVFVYRVDLTGNQMKTLSPVVKFSERQHAIPEATQIHLATPGYYRKYEESESNIGIRDEKEAQYERRTDMQTFLDEHKVPAPAGASHVSVKLTYASNDFWMFCTSVQPDTDWELRKMRRALNYDCATIIANPSEFAKELGAAFAAHSEWSDVSLSSLDKLCRILLPQEFGDKVVWVYHGPVVYSSNCEKVIEAFPEDRRAEVVSFVKRDQFSNQREYRFTVSIRGEPKEPGFYMPVSPPLRHLSRIEK